MLIVSDVMVQSFTFDRLDILTPTLRLVCSILTPESSCREIIPHFPDFLPSPSLICCAILQMSFGDKGPHLRRCLITQHLSDGLLAEVFLNCKVNVMRSVHSPWFHLIIILPLADGYD